jgi:protein-disulfide isomerase
VTTRFDVPGAVASDDDVLTFRVRRSVLTGGLGALIGFAVGLGAARYVLPLGPTAGAATTVISPNVIPTATAPPAALGLGAPTRIPIPTEGRPARGPSNAPVTIVEFTDYECPFCRQHFAQTLPLLLKQYGDRVRYVVLNYPIPSLHPDAAGAAEAAECAAAQGKFWEYHDGLLAAPSLERGSLTKLAERVKLDRRSFAACLDTKAHAELVGRDIALGTSLGVTGTPAFFINGRFLDGAYPFPVFQAAIDSALASAGR